MTSSTNQKITASSTGRFSPGDFYADSTLYWISLTPRVWSWNYIFFEVICFWGGGRIVTWLMSSEVFREGLTADQPVNWDFRSADAPEHWPAQSHGAFFFYRHCVEKVSEIFTGGSCFLCTTRGWCRPFGFTGPWAPLLCNGAVSRFIEGSRDENQPLQVWVCLVEGGDVQLLWLTVPMSSASAQLIDNMLTRWTTLSLHSLQMDASSSLPPKRTKKNPKYPRYACGHLAAGILEFEQLRSAEFPTIRLLSQSKKGAQLSIATIRLLVVASNS